MDKLNKMTIFCRVVELGSFASASKDLNLTPAIVGRHIADLEAMLKTRLLARTTRSMNLTEAGRQYYQGCKESIAKIEEIEHEILLTQNNEPQGVLRVAAPEGLGAPILLDVIEQVKYKYPKIRFEVVLDNNQNDLVSSSVDVSIRLAVKLEDSTAIVKSLGQTCLRLMASPEYIKRFGVPNSANELEEHSCVNFAASRFGDSWPIQTNKLEKLRLPWDLVSNNTSFYKEAIKKGFGIGLLPEIMASVDLQSGDLQLLNVDLQFPEIGIYALYPSRAYQPAKLRVFLQELSEYFKNEVTC